MAAVPTFTKIAALVSRCRKQGATGPWRELIDALAVRARHEREFDLLAFLLVDELVGRGHNGWAGGCSACDLVRKAQELGVVKPHTTKRHQKPPEPR